MKVIKNTGVNYDKILIVGGFNVSGGSNGKGILRLTKDGNVDTTFNTGALATTTSVRGVSGSNWQARTCYVYPDLNPDGSPNSNAGRILIGGMFDFYNGFSAHKLVKLSANGDYQVGTFNTNINTIIDPTVLQAQQGFNSSPDAIAVQSDGKIIVGGYFGWYNGIYVGGILRLNLDGNLDVSFNHYPTFPGISTNFYGDPKFSLHISQIVIQPDDKIIIAGEFTHYNMSSSNNIARLLADGFLDTSFNVGSGFNNTVLNPITETYGLVRSLVLKVVSPTNWQLYVSGDFTAYNNSACDEIIRIRCSTGAGTNNITGFRLSNGGPNGYQNGPVWNMKQQGDGKIVIGGGFTTYYIFSALNVTRILPSSNSTEAKNSTVYYDSEPEIDLFSTADLVINPNPSNGKINFTSAVFNDEPFSIAVYTVIGIKVVELTNLHKDTNTLDVSELANGNYFITFTSNEKTITKAIIISKK